MGLFDHLVSSAHARARTLEPLIGPSRWGPTPLPPTPDVEALGEVLRPANPVLQQPQSARPQTRSAPDAPTHRSHAPLEDAPLPRPLARPPMPAAAIEPPRSPPRAMPPQPKVESPAKAPTRLRDNPPLLGATRVHTVLDRVVERVEQVREPQPVPARPPTRPAPRVDTRQEAKPVAIKPAAPLRPIEHPRTPIERPQPPAAPQRRSAPPTVAHPASRAEPPAAASQPTVIRIGRLIVRAPEPAKRAQRTEPSTRPVQSLSAYLSDVERRRK